MPNDNAKVEAGYDASKLDPAIAGAIDRLSKCIDDIERLRGGVEPFLDEVRKRLTAQLEAGGMADPAVLTAAERWIEWLEKYTRLTLSLTKIADEATRLRSFVAGGADSRPDLASLSDAALGDMLKAALSRGAPAK